MKHDASQRLSKSRRQPFRGRSAFEIGEAISTTRSAALGFSRCEADLRKPPTEEPFPEAWRAYLRDNVFLYNLLSDADQARLRREVRRFIAAKFWEGCAGLRITEEMQVTIAAQACLLLLGLDGCWFAEPKSILVYPGGYLGIDPDQNNVRPAHRLGECHLRGPIVLSWWHTRWGGRYWHRQNLVLHEFAQKLAEGGDPYTGLPFFDDPQQAERWKAVMDAEHRQLIDDAAYQRPTVLHPYGAVNPPEFFAVASECFFLRPLALGQRHPVLYQVLAEWYRLDPAQWRVDEAADAQAAVAEEEELHHALIESDAILDRFPNDLDTHRQRAVCWCALEEFDNALVECTRLVALASKPRKADAYSDRGWIQYQAGRYDEAIEDFSEAIHLRPDLADAYCGRGTVYAVREDFVRASADLTRALRLDPRDDSALLWRAYVRRETGKPAKALRDLDRAIQLCPHRADGYRERGLIYLHGNEHDRALADLSTAILLDPDDADAYSARAEAFEAKGRTVEAARDRSWAEQLRMRSRSAPSHRASFRRDGILKADAASLVGLRRASRRR
ncbi:MAG TPA: zinc-dependent peptidase [Gemmataceae bacterium]|jgi:hypothetical protein